MEINDQERVESQDEFEIWTLYQRTTCRQIHLMDLSNEKSEQTFETLYIQCISSIVSKFLCAALFANARKVDINEIQINWLGHSETPTTQPTFFKFLSQIKGSWREKFTSRFLATLKLSTDKR